MKRKTYVIEAENGVGLYFSECLMENSFEYLSHFDRRILPFDTFEAAKQYVFYKYENDGEIDLEKLIWRNSGLILRLCGITPEDAISMCNLKK